MNCGKVRKFVFLYTDNEMDEELLASFVSHVDGCPECARQTRQAVRLVRVVRRCVRLTAPEKLKIRLRTNLSK